MTDFKIGDRVEVFGYATPDCEWNGPATVVEVNTEGLVVDRDGGGWATNGYFSFHYIRRLTGPRVTVRETIVVNFEDDEYELTTEEANALIRSLEMAVA